VSPTKPRASLMAATAVAMAVQLATAAPLPTGDEVIHRILGVNRNTPDIISADVLFKFRFRKPVSAPPDCVFKGTVRVEHGHELTLTVGQRTEGLACWAIDKYVLGRLFESREPVERMISRYDFEVLGEKLVDGHPYYLVRARAREPKTNPRGWIGWVDYDRGLVPEGTVEYAWGTIDTEQKYMQVSEAWVLSYQYLYTPRFDASMEVFYSNFHFAPRAFAPSAGLVPR